MTILLAGKSVYHSEAIVVARSFELGPKLEYSETLWRAYPDNPQLAYNRAVDLQANQRCGEVLSSLSHVKLEAFGSKVRRKVEDILVACKTE